MSQLALPAPDAVATALEGLTAAITRHAELAGGPAADAHRMARLLSAALAHNDAHPRQPCPVCAGRVLDDR
jgi:hypothetical protein